MFIIDLLFRFRWVICQLDALKRCLKVSLIREALKNLPRTLDDLMHAYFLDIDEVYLKEAKNALLWLAFSVPPLQLTELAEATAIDPGPDPPFSPKERFQDPQNVFQILSSLITVSSYEDQDCMSHLDTADVAGPMVTVILAHFSVKEYLISDRIHQSPAKHFAASDPIAHWFIAKCCLMYILYYSSSDLKTESRTDLFAFPLLEYASTYWYAHIKLAPCEQQKMLNPLVLKLLLSNSALSSWLPVHNPTAPTVKPFERFEDVTIPLFYVSDMGLPLIVQELLADGWDLNAVSRWHETPLHRAVIRGYEDVVQILLKHGAEVNATDEIGWTPLHLAALHSYEPIACLVVENGAQVDATTEDLNQTPLHWAAFNENGPLLEFLLGCGADINAKNIYGESALHYAAASNCQSILQQLLANDANLDIETICGETPLSWAAHKNQRQSVETLVKAGARIDLPLLLLARKRCHSAFHLLLSVSTTNAKSASMRQMVLSESARRMCELCDECRNMLL